MAPIEYPSVTLNGRQFFFRASLAALRRLQAEGVTGAPDNPAEAGHYIAVQAAALAHVVDSATGSLKAAGLSASEMEEMIELGDVPDIRTALEQALVKAPRTPQAPLGDDPQTPQIQ